jgi:hypothetical protein
LTAYYAGGTGYVSAIDIAGGNGLQVGNSRIESSFEVLGPANSNVPLVLSLTGTTSVTSGAGYAEDDVTLVTGPTLGTTVYQVSACTDSFYVCASSTPPVGSSLSIQQSFVATTNTLYDLFLTAGFYEVNGATTSASIDPSVAFGSQFDPSGYQIIFSADATPPPAVPLPASSLLLFSGLLGVFGVAKMRRPCQGVSV